MKKVIYLFQGDSITDCNRNQHDFYGLGDGYVSILQERHPDLLILNRGISGNRVNELILRWQTDVMDIHPSVLSIYIGINDIWHHHEWGKPYSIDAFTSMYQQLIDQTLAKKPNTKLLLISPFVLKMGHYKAVWQKDLDDIIQAVHELSNKNKTLYLSLTDVFNEAVKTHSMDDLTWDGVHPKTLGHELIATAIEHILHMK